MRAFCLIFALAFALHGSEEPAVVRAWMLNPSAATASAALRRVLPNVLSVRVESEFVQVESAGISLHSLGAIEAGGWELVLGPRRFVFRIPLKPRRAKTPPLAPLGITGAFLNGVPLFTPVSPVSWRDQNIWHLDAVASQQRAGQGTSPLLSSLLESSARHSPLIGFALDGFPIYGPYGWGEAGKVRRFRSGYRLRNISRRSVLPDGTALSPSQEGPLVNGEYALGSFVEDYEYVAGTGDLDEHNGRFAKTPEYPNGTYAYFLGTDAEGAMAFPYLVGRTYYGEIPHASQGAAGVRIPALNAPQIELMASGPPQAGDAVSLNLSIRDSLGRRIRFLEKIHEQPIHLAIVSTDLAEFAHIHPVLQSDDTYGVSHTFAQGGVYWLYADYTPPGGVRIVARFRVEVKGEMRPAEPLISESQPNVTRTRDGLQIRLTIPASMRAGQDLRFRFETAVSDLEPYLGAWAHVMILSQDRQEFIHAHPLDDAATTIDNNPWQHSHAAPGPSPSVIETVTGFRKPGIYRMWAQFQRGGKVITFPFTIKVLPVAKTAMLPRPNSPPDAIRVDVSTAGFSPARISAAAGKLSTLAFIRSDARSCANAVAFPELGIRKDLPVGETVLVEIPASESGRELHFACGMNMYRGSILIRRGD